MRRVRQGRSIWVGICVVVMFFAGVTLAFAWLGGGPDIPHSVDGDRAACTTCHPTDGLPDGHHDLVNSSCRSCHSENSSHASVPVGGADSVESEDDGSFQAAEAAAVSREIAGTGGASLGIMAEQAESIGA